MSWKFYTSDGAEKLSEAGSGAVLESDFDANSILASDADDSPTVRTIAVQQIVGRITAGNIKGLTAAEVLTLIGVTAGADPTAANETSHADVLVDGDVGIADDKILQVDGTPLDTEIAVFTDAGINGKSMAEALALLFAVALPENTTIKLDPVLSADTKWSGITEDGTAGTTALVYGYCYYLASTGKWEKTNADAVATSINKLGMCVVAADADATGTLLLWGNIRADDEFPAFTVGAPVFLSEDTAGILKSAAPEGTDEVVRIVGQAMTADSLFFSPESGYATVT